MRRLLAAAHCGLNPNSNPDSNSNLAANKSATKTPPTKTMTTMTMGGETCQLRVCSSARFALSAGNNLPHYWRASGRSKLCSRLMADGRWLAAHAKRRRFIAPASLERAILAAAAALLSVLRKPHRPAGKKRSVRAACKHIGRQPPGYADGLQWRAERDREG